MSWSLGQRCLAEFLGTYILVFSIVAAVVFTETEGGFDPAARVALAGLAIAFGAVAAIYAFGDLSGGHLNPAVTVGLWVLGRFRGRDVVPYVLAQVAGSFVAAATVAGVAHGASAIWNGAIPIGFASQGYSGNGSPYAYAWPSVFLAEVAGTLVLVLVALRTTRNESFSKNLAPVGIGLTVGLMNLVLIPVDGASVNPARSFGPALFAAYFSGGRWAIQQDWLFWVAPVVGGLIAAAIERALRAGSDPA